ncbi:MAG TPA: ABC transporter ATP-binding protein/permease [Candidatus Agrococcus pullicola]|uniref:ABC transporter ATP-binding protein/permease n=1 Tax=Candidatus Agrococcus pullicola TaxID=2838429 RepID=A0A9D1YUD3_9MICO|nr:ABC transporter ATP-binding protein/permease [Candidatus Agrococcus pullicola]
MPDSATESQPTPFSVLWSFVRPYLPVLVLGLFLALIVSAMGLASPMVTKWVLDTLEVGGSLLQPVLVLLVLLVVGATVGWFQWVLLGKLAEDVVFDARRRMILRYLGSRVLELLKRGPGELVTRVTSDTVLLNQAASSSLIGLINGAITLVGSIILMATLDGVLLITAVVAVVVVVLSFTLLMPAIAKAEERAQAALGDLGSELEGTVRAIKTVKSSGAEERRTARLLHHASESRRHSMRSVRIGAGVWTIAGTGIELAIIAVLAIGAYRVSEGYLTVSALVAFLLYVWGLTGPIMELAQNLTTLQSGLAAAARIRQVEQIPLEANVDAGTSRQGRRVPEALEGADSSGTLLELRDVSVRYEDDAAPAVTGIDLQLPRRGHIALVGPSGAGKTTLLSLMLRFVEPRTGEVLLRGTPYEQLTHAQARANFAYVEQETPVVPGTIRENLLFANPDASEEQIASVLQRLHLAEKFAELPDGLDTALTETNVSGGQRQRIALARALLAEPSILLLDEATAQVDGVTEAAIQQEIAERSHDALVLTIAHRLSTVIDADEIVVMDNGSIAARGTHEQLLTTNDLYRELVAALRIDTGAEHEPKAEART